MSSSIAKPVMRRLCEGDHLTFDEYILRWESMPEFERQGMRPELIDGRVYMNAAAIRYVEHGQPQRLIVGLFERYVDRTPGVDWASPTTAKFDDRNAPEPDAELFVIPEYGGRVRVEDGFLVGAPELVVEIAGSSASYDLYEKKAMYERFGVLEYLVWRTEDGEFDCFDLQDQIYIQRDIPPGQNWESRIFPGLIFDIPVLLQRDRLGAYATLDRCLGSDEHQAFVETLQARRK